MQKKVTIMDLEIPLIPSKKIHPTPRQNRMISRSDGNKNGEDRKSQSRELMRGRSVGKEVEGIFGERRDRTIVIDNIHRIKETVDVHLIEFLDNTQTMINSLSNEKILNNNINNNDNEKYNKENNDKEIDLVIENLIKIKEIANEFLNSSADLILFVNPCLLIKFLFIFIYFNIKYKKKILLLFFY